MSARTHAPIRAGWGWGCLPIDRFAPKIDAVFTEEPIVQTLELLAAILFPANPRPAPPTDDADRRSTVGVPRCAPPEYVQYHRKPTECTVEYR